MITMFCASCRNINGQAIDAEPDVALCDHSHIRRALEDMQRLARGRGRAIFSDSERALLASRWISIETCSAIAGASLPDDEYYVRRLQRVLGILKDPHTAAFLRCHWSRHSNYGLDAWISGWRSHTAYYALHADEWSAISRHWSVHFQWMLRQRLDSRVRVEVLRAVDEWFFDEAMTTTLLEYRGRADLNVEESLVVEAALSRRNQLSKERLETAFDQLSQLDPKSFVFYAQTYPTAECVRPLIRLSAEDGEIGTAAERLLQQIAFRERPSDGWLQWWECNRTTPRTVWLDEITSPVTRAIAENNWPPVRFFIEEHGLRNDAVFVEWVTQLATHEPLAEDLANFLRPSLNPRYSGAITRALAQLRRQAEKDEGLAQVLRRQLLVPLSWQDSLEELDMHGTR